MPKITREEAEKLEEKTRKQAGCPLWKDERQWRLTSSRFGEILSITERRDIYKLCESMYAVKELKSESIVHGKTYEPIAREKYEKVKMLQSSIVIVSIYHKHPTMGT